MCRSMVDIQCAAAEIRRGKKIERRNKPQGKNIMSASATQGGHNNKKAVLSQGTRSRDAGHLYRKLARNDRATQ